MSEITNEYIDIYQDPENVDEIIDEIKKLPTIGDIKPIVDKYFPKWIIGTIYDYSEDYPTLRSNWHTVCNMMKVKPTQIMVVDSDLVFDTNHKLIVLLSEILTRSGFCVRSKNHIFSCKNCGKGIPQSTVYDLLKSKNIKVPNVWSTICEKC
jgi:hypothetical protein